MTTLPQGDPPRQIPLFAPIEIPLTKGYVALIDPIDADLAGRRWFAIVRRPSCPYGGNWTPQKTLLLHRIILSRMLERQLTHDEWVDHIDGNTLNNRRDNLRLCTRSQNMRNQGANRRNTSGYKGVDWNKDRRVWRAHITVDNRKIYLGYFDTAEEAHKAYCEASAKYHGEFGRTK